MWLLAAELSESSQGIIVYFSAKNGGFPDVWRMGVSDGVNFGDYSLMSDSRKDDKSYGF